VVFGDVGVKPEVLKIFRDRLVAEQEGASSPTPMPDAVTPPNTTFPWTGGTVPYRFDPTQVTNGTITAAKMQQFRDGIGEWAGAANVRFVWSPNPNLFQRRAEWARKLRRYWPGSRYVDAVGSTMINFGGRKDYRVARWAPRLRDLHRRYREPVMLTETNTAYRGRVRWLKDLRRMLRRTPWIRAVVWSQLTSRGKAQMKDAGRVDWDVQHDPPAAAVLRQIIRDGSS